MQTIEDLIQFFRKELAERREYSASKCFEIAIEKCEELKNNKIDFMDWEYKGGMYFCPFCKKEQSV